MKRRSSWATGLAYDGKKREGRSGRKRKKRGVKRDWTGLTVDIHNDLDELYSRIARLGREGSVGDRVESGGVGVEEEEGRSEENVQKEDDWRDAERWNGGRWTTPVVSALIRGETGMAASKKEKQEEGESARTKGVRAKRGGVDMDLCQAGIPPRTSLAGSRYSAGRLETSAISRLSTRSQSSGSCTDGVPVTGDEGSTPEPDLVPELDVLLVGD